MLVLTSLSTGLNKMVGVMVSGGLLSRQKVRWNRQA